MKKILLLPGLFFLSLWMTGCSDPLEDSTFAAYEDKPVGIYLEAQPEYSQWVAILKRTNLFNALNISATKFTCFVADNVAVNDYLRLKNYNSVDDIPLKEASYLMRYHIIPGNSYMHTALGGQIPDTTASGDYLSVVYRSGGINSMYVNDTALIIRKDIQVINGYLHKINSLLDPIMESVWDIIDKNENYSIFRDALQLCKLDNWLQSRTKTIKDKAIHDYKTVLIPSDQTFRNEGISSLDGLRQRFPGEDYANDTCAFYKFVAYHIINSYSDFSKLSDFGSGTAQKLKNLSTAASDAILSVEEVNKKIVFNSQADSVFLVPGRYDQHGNNGYVHEINKIMPVAVARQATVIWDFCDIEDCRVLDMYRKWEQKYDQKTYAIDRESPIDIKWSTIPENDDAVKYQLRTVDWNKTSNDLLWMNLGFVGWVEITTPPIAPGKYKISIYKFNYSARGICQAYIDNDKIGPQLDFSGNGKNPQELGIKIFPTTKRHVIRFSAIKKGAMEVDRLVFEPVTE